MSLNLSRMDNISYSIQGNIDKDFKNVKIAFENNFKLGQEIASQLCIYHNNKCVVD